MGNKLNGHMNYLRESIGNKITIIFPYIEESELISILQGENLIKSINKASECTITFYLEPNIFSLSTPNGLHMLIKSSQVKNILKSSLQKNSKIIFG